MLKTLLKKQLYEINRSFFYDQKKNKARSKAASAVFILLYAFLMIGIISGGIAVFAALVCAPLIKLGFGWFYLLIFSAFSLFLGIFGSVFNTYAGLYRAKDNDLLLSMPIPVSAIMFSRLLGVYLMGLMFSGVVIVPAIIVYLCITPFSLSALFGGIMLVLLISLIVFVLSCLLGWVVAKITDKLKNKSIITVLISLVLFGAYYFFYFKLNDIMRSLIENVEEIGDRVRGSAYAVYLFGRIGEGDAAAIIIYTVAVAAALAVTYILISRSFLQLATSSGKTARIEYRETAARKGSADTALLRKEFRRFTGSPAYMLNCGMGTLFAIVIGVLIIVKHSAVVEFVSLLGPEKETVYLIVAGVLCMIGSMNDTAVPSVSLEGKSLWLLQSLPVEPWRVLRAKLRMQLLLTAPPMLFCCLCAAAVLKSSPIFAVLLIVFPLIYSIFSACFGLMIGVLKPNLNWTNEITPIKQSLSVMLVLFSGWIFAGVVIGLYFLIGKFIGAAAYLSAVSLLTAVASVLIISWLKRSGSRIFAAL